MPLMSPPGGGDMSIERKPVLYMAGPYSAHPNWCTWAAMNTAKAITMYTGWTPLVPHLTHFWDIVFPAPYEFWLDYDRDLLAVCDGFVRLPGRSHGADTEAEWAVRYDLEIVEFDKMPDEVQASWMIAMRQFGLIDGEGVNHEHHQPDPEPA